MKLRSTREKVRTFSSASYRMRISRIRKRNEFRFILYYPLDLGWFALDPVLVFKLRITQGEPSIDVVIVR